MGAPCALAAIYSHPLEFLICDILPLGSGLFVMGSNIFVMITFVFFAIVGTQNHHCGFRFPHVPTGDHQPDFHDEHHEKFTGNYGNTGLLDVFHGTLLPKARKHYFPEIPETKEAAKQSGEENSDSEKKKE